MDVPLFFQASQYKEGSGTFFDPPVNTSMLLFIEFNQLFAVQIYKLPLLFLQHHINTQVIQLSLHFFVFFIFYQSIQLIQQLGRSQFRFNRVLQAIILVIREDIGPKLLKNFQQVQFYLILQIVLLSFQMVYFEYRANLAQNVFDLSCNRSINVCKDIFSAFTEKMWPICKRGQGGWQHGGNELFELRLELGCHHETGACITDIWGYLINLILQTFYQLLTFYQFVFTLCQLL